MVELDRYRRRTVNTGVVVREEGENRTEREEVPNVGASTGSATSDVLKLIEALS